MSKQTRAKVKQITPIRATAERIAEWLQTKEQLIGMIETALLAERERAAKIVNDARFESGTDLRELAARIRNGD